MIPTPFRRPGPVVFISSFAIVAFTIGIADAKKCTADSVQVGPVCVDKYEASVWSTTDAKLVKSIQKGKIGEVADLAGAVAHGVAGDDYGAGCDDTGNGCADYYAVSLAGVTPSTNLTWFQAVAACRNSGKRLATNVEWQAAAFGTPDPGTDNGTTDCNVDSVATSATGARASCVSDVGAIDMVGNVSEWVADWGDRASACSAWGAPYSADVSCYGGDGSVTARPGALSRGGSFSGGDTQAGAFFVNTGIEPQSTQAFLGFRCAR